MSTNDEDVPVEVSKTKARGGVTGHNVRYVLILGLAGVILGMVIAYLFFFPR